MKRELSLFILLSICSAAVTGCIKEDRGPCPCLLIADLSHISRLDGYTDEFALDITTCTGWTRTSLFPLDSMPKEFRIQVPKDTFYVLSLHGNGNQLRKTPYCITIEKGDEMQPISSGLDTLYCNWEEIHSTSYLHKNYTECFLILGDELDREIYDYSAEIIGDVNGIDLRFNSPIPGEFQCRKQFKGDTLSIKVPRQKSNTLILNIYKENICVNGIDLGKQLADDNYNWGEPVLKNICFTVGCNKQTGAISIENWKYANTIKEEM